MLRQEVCKVDEALLMSWATFLNQLYIININGILYFQMKQFLSKDVASGLSGASRYTLRVTCCKDFGKNLFLQSALLVHQLTRGSSPFLCHAATSRDRIGHYPRSQKSLRSLGAISGCTQTDGCLKMRFYVEVHV